MTTITLEKGIAFFEDGSEVSNVSVDLVKAAPDLLKALIECHHSLLSHHTDGHSYLLDGKRINMAQAAITKATGL